MLIISFYCAKKRPYCAISTLPPLIIMPIFFPFKFITKLTSCRQT
ncbi:hypothetical protein PROPEN_03985 [Proteus penneri ATCC 35198]|nr:hypothetical protein PROPEN_03985 [Proteus penneri ATCC 35198]